MFELKLDPHVFERKARQLGGADDQIAFALSQAMNEAVRNARQVLVQSTWPRNVEQRNQAFISRALRTSFATKKNLRVEIYDDLGRASLRLHADGGTRRARGRMIAIPPGGSVTRSSRGAHGVRKNLRPAALIARTPKRALRVTPKGIFVAKGGHLHLMFAFKSRAEIKPDVPFREDFEVALRADLRTSFPAAMARAMATRR